MSDIPLTHLSRPQLVHLLLRIVDLLSQPVQPATFVPSGTPLEPYDASLDPWNAPDVGQPTNAGVGGSRGPVPGNPYPHPSQLNPGATAFYPVVSGPPGPGVQLSCLDHSAGLPWFGTHPKQEGTVSVGGQDCAGRDGRYRPLHTCVWWPMWYLWCSLCVATCWPFEAPLCNS